MLPSTHHRTPETNARQFDQTVHYVGDNSDEGERHEYLDEQPIDTCQRQRIMYKAQQRLMYQVETVAGKADRMQRPHEEA